MFRLSIASQLLLVSTNTRVVRAAQRHVGLFDHDNINIGNPNDLVEFTARKQELNELRKKRKETTLLRKAFGIPFVVSDNRALDAVTQHHRAAVQLHSVERFMVPFWLAAAQAGGTFKATVLHQTQSFSAATTRRWSDTPIMDFAYPFGEHVRHNQVAASYGLSIPLVEEALRGDHVPSMLMSREELLEELTEMKTPPSLLEFDRSTESAVAAVRRRIGRSVIDAQVRQELRKYFGNYSQAHVVLLGTSLSVDTVRPVFLPLYKLEVSTQFHTKPVPAFVCGATARVAGPVISLPRRKFISMALTSAFSAFAVTLLTVGPLPAVGAATACGGAVMMGTTHYRHLKARAAIDSAAGAHVAEQARSASLDMLGWKWTVAEEEKLEYRWREQLREKARKRAEFEQRVREETARENAELGFDPRLRAGARGRKAAQGMRDPDPCKYYDVLGLAGREKTATAKDIQQAFRVEAQKNHPDLHAGNEAAANEAMQRILEAYSVLRDTKLRKEYDSGRMLARDRA